MVVRNTEAVFQFVASHNTKYAVQQDKDPTFSQLSCYVHHGPSKEQSWFVLAVDFASMINAMVIPHQILTSLPMRRDDFIRHTMVKTPTRKCWTFFAPFSELGIDHVKQIVTGMNKVHPFPKILAPMLHLIDNTMQAALRKKLLPAEKYSLTEEQHQWLWSKEKGVLRNDIKASKDDLSLDAGDPDQLHTLPCDCTL